MKLIKVIFKYDDGSSKFLDRKNSEIFHDNIIATNSLFVKPHFDPIEWTELKEGDTPIFCADCHKPITNKCNNINCISNIL